MSGVLPALPTRHNGASHIPASPTPAHPTPHP